MKSALCRSCYLQIVLIESVATRSYKTGISRASEERKEAALKQASMLGFDYLVTLAHMSQQLATVKNANVAGL
jgi:hypothetical protein